MAESRIHAFHEPLPFAGDVDKHCRGENHCSSVVVPLPGTINIQLLVCMLPKVKSVSHSVVSNSLWSMDCSLPNSSVHGILWARILEWLAITFPSGSFWPRDWTQVSCIAGEGNGNPLQYSCLENPMDGGAWWAAIYGIAQSQTQLKQLSSSSSSSCIADRFFTI